VPYPLMIVRSGIWSVGLSLTPALFAGDPSFGASKQSPPKHRAGGIPPSPLYVTNSLMSDFAGINEVIFLGGPCVRRF